MKTVKELKQEAWDYKKLTGLPHHQCLREVAIRHGFKNWEHLTRDYKGPLE